jgi:acyl carrier protein
MPDVTTDELRRLLVEVTRPGVDPASVPDDEALGLLGVNSLASMRFLVAVEERYGIRIADADLSLNLLDDLTALTSYVRQRSGDAS